ncbi:alpha/beta hydrolase [Luteipulveratus mongoliensis]|uniref:Alpha/beta hydrolase n=1 Tax=Luteipulveratus mongoliensis TaxID=571913 RepID=A0A0K1JM05_9MICO|nr:alpha/beta fold hydrolase [Luteipulveratus mongoliensis]AKU17623.1 alpha/beta hydrolase [Luteipulveratus mongoliensis]
MKTAQREKVRFISGGIECAAWHYPGTNGACVVMAGGGGVPKEPGTDRFAARFHADGFTVLAFDYRHLGESGGTPRQVVRAQTQLEDWSAAVAFAGTLGDVDPDRIAAWGFSLSGGHVFRVAADNRVAAAIAQTPFADGLAAVPNTLRHETLGVVLRFPLLALRDAVRGLLGRDPLVVPLVGPRGTVAMLTTPDAQDGSRALNPDNRYPEWQQTIAARSVLPLGSYRPGRSAARIECPLLVLVCDADQSVLAAPAVRAADLAPRSELVRLPGGHYAPFLDEHERAIDVELDFLRRHLLEVGARGA